MSREHRRPRAALAYALTSAALATAFAAGPAVMTGAAAQAGLTSAAAHATPFGACPDPGPGTNDGCTIKA
jgi:hypothetical protein